MAVRRRPPRRKLPRKTPGATHTTLGAVGGGELGEAADVIAEYARTIASGWSKQIPLAIEVQVDEGAGVATISCDAPPAYPGETRARHPLFGDREHWYPAPGVPFLGPAADIKAGDAMAKYAKKIDRLCREAGFE